MTTDPTPHTERAAAAANSILALLEPSFGAWTGKDEQVAAIIAKHFNDDALRLAAERYEAAIRWALGEIDDFPPREEGQGKYWWRTELRRRAALAGDKGKET